MIATKGGLRMTDAGLVRDASPRWLRAGVEASLTALGIEHIDLYQVHWPDPTVPAAETAGALGELVAEGKIAHVGVSNYDAAQMAEFAATLPVETLQPPVSPVPPRDRGRGTALQPRRTTSACSSTGRWPTACSPAR